MSQAAAAKTSPNTFYEKKWVNETGGFVERDTLSFLNMTGEKYIAANSRPPMEVRTGYWQLRQGMNICGVCDNMDCSVFGSCVSLQVEGGGLGLGTFDVRKEMPSRFVCPQCMKTCNSKTVSCSFYRCRWKYEGVALEWDGSHFACVKKSGGGVANMTNAYLSCNTANSWTKWTELKIVVEGIKDCELVKLYSSSSDNSGSKLSSEEEEDTDD
eukprot:PITA_16249